ncbi:MAG: hypothetical protein HOG94_01460 [Nitrospinaceae bacterium]|jgi:hypothetical protein|nr:hypothetical protein [Nitrospinaceae bacterium]
MDWTSLLIFGGLMFVMHRFGLGCCGGHGHGGHDDHKEDDDNGRSPQLENESKNESASISKISAKAGD